MDEPFDEIMGPPQRPPPSSLSTRDDPAPTVTPDPSPSNASVLTRSSSTTSSSGAPPPMSAFVTSPAAKDRWDQYEPTEQESQRAHANAVAAAATTRRSSSFRSSSRRSSSYQEDQDVSYDRPDRVRAEALQLLEMADSSGSSSHRLVRTSTGGYTTASSSSRRKPAALAGLDLSANAARQSRTAASTESRRLSMLNDTGNDDDDLVDINNMERRHEASKSNGYRDDNDAASSSSQRSSWSSRYTMDHHLQALNGMSSKEMLAQMDREAAQYTTSARNMFQTSPHLQQKSPKIFGTGGGFTFRKKHLDKLNSPDFNLQSHKTVWMDGDGLTSNGNSLPPIPPTHHHWQDQQTRVKRRRIGLACVGLVVVLAIIIGVAVSSQQDNDTNANAGKTTGSGAAEGGLHFYVTANSPYGTQKEDKLGLDLVALPDDASFVVHLGNIQEASVTLCPGSVYKDVSALLKRSVAPLFVIPGEQDWNNCPRPSRAYQVWKKTFGTFDVNFDHGFTVNRQLGQEENFSFLEKGVLFLGLHLVGGHVDDPDEWDLRHAKDARWVEEQLQVFGSDEYRAVVLFGNARPSLQQEDFFTSAAADLAKRGKPAMYVHANSGNGEFKEYKPFPGVASNLLAAEIRDGAPMRITVGFGKRPFTWSQ